MSHTLAYRHWIRLLQQARRLNLHAQGKPAPLPSPGRRRFLRNTVVGGLGLTALGGFTACAPGKNKVVVVGGGLAGLNAAYQLGLAGVRAQVFEARNRVGGRIRSVLNAVSEGVVTDLGAELVNTDHEDLRALLDAFGIPLMPRKDDALLDMVGYFFGGSRRDEAEIAAALAPFAAQVMEDSERLDTDWDTYGPQFDQLSLADYLDLHGHLLPADPDLRTLIESLIRVEYGVEPENSSALQLLYVLPVVDGEQVELISTSDEAWVIQGGSESVIKALHGVLAPQVQTDMALTALRKTRDGYRLTFNNHHSVDADYVVLALPLTALRQVDLQLELPESLQRFISEVSLGRNEKIVAGVQQRVWRTEQGFRNECWSDQSVALLWDSSLRELASRENGALTFFLGGHEVEETAHGRAEKQGARLVQEYDNVLPGLLANSNGRYVRTAWHRTAGIMGGYTNFRPGQYTEFASEWMYVESDDPDEANDAQVDRLLLAGEHTSDDYYGFMNGAAQTGRLA
ncbi:MAG TPA: NAD(P)/FAD-dependent oxidoreductase, partial [Dongiaceae bacterium]|nr:NAD(P)/FAD-dependent oxidoreductase [Dongiaceae bacterium]